MRRKTRWLVATLAAVMIGAPGIASADVGAAGNLDIERVMPIKDKGQYVYSVKMLCGTIISNPNMPQFPGDDNQEFLVPGTYLTIVNIHNLSSKTTNLQIHAVNSDGPAEFSVTEIILANHERQLDCETFVDNFSDAADIRLILTESFYKGFFRLSSDVEHAVVGIYSYKNVETGGR